MPLGASATGVVQNLVLLSPVMGASFTLVLPRCCSSRSCWPWRSRIVVFDGDSNWLEGATMITLYAIVATAFWWG